MPLLLRLVALTGVLLMTISCAENSRYFADPKCEGRLITKDSRNTDQPGIITSEHQLYGRSCYQKIIKNVLENSKKPFVLFVHGRGKHPSKEVRLDLINKIETQYEVTVLMYTWPSYCGFPCFPKKRAEYSAFELNDVLPVLKEIKDQEKGNKSFSILAHNMGGIVTSKIKQHPKFLDNLILSGSAAPFKNHQAWVDDIGLAKRIFITSNESDGVLKCVEGHNIICPLAFSEPLSLGRWGFGDLTPENLSEKAKYINLSAVLNSDHVYYINQKNRNLALFYKSILRGTEPRFDLLEEVTTDKVYKMTK